MGNTEIQSKVNEFRELRRMSDELAAEIESIQNAIKAHMTAIDADTVAADIHGEYLTDNMGGFRIGQKVVLILRVDDVPIGHLAIDALAPLGF